MAGVLFEDIFNVKDIDPEGKKFDRGRSLYRYKYWKIRTEVMFILTYKRITRRQPQIIFFW